MENETYLTKCLTNETVDGHHITFADYDEVQVGKVLREAAFLMHEFDEPLVLVYSTRDIFTEDYLKGVKKWDYADLMVYLDSFREVSNFHLVAFGKKLFRDNEAMLKALRLDRGWLRLQRKYNAKNYSLRVAPKLDFKGKTVAGSDVFSYVACFHSMNGGYASLAHYLFYLKMFPQLEAFKSKVSFDRHRKVERCQIVCSK